MGDGDLRGQAVSRDQRAAGRRDELRWGFAAALTGRGFFVGKQPFAAFDRALSLSLSRTHRRSQHKIPSMSNCAQSTRAGRSRAAGLQCLTRFRFFDLWSDSLAFLTHT